MSPALAVVTAAALALAWAAQMARWLRVLQREHYDPRAMSRFLGRWTSPPAPSARTLGSRGPSARPARRPFTLSHALILVVAMSLLLRADGLLVAASAVYGILCPVGLSLRGRTGVLVFTQRLSTTAIVATVVSAAVAGVGLATTRPYLGAVVAVWAVPPVLDLSTRLLAPLEERRARHFVERAARRLATVHPRVVGITGSYGKTSTKNHLAQLIQGTRAVVATPRSYNNRAGLSRAINEGLVEGTEVFVAEMGTYGPGEIRELCRWFPPEVSVVTAIGPVHLERMGSLDVIETAKREITERATTAVLNVDDPRLSGWVTPLRVEGKRVITAASAAAADVRVALEGDQWRVVVGGEEVACVPAVAGVQATNVACAIGAALALEVPLEAVVAGLGRLAPVEHRQGVARAASGVTVIDDTFNANPASAMSALETLRGVEGPGRRVVVTPGLVELGREQHTENLRLGRRVAAIGAELVVVQRTNVVALALGFEGPLRRFDRRDQAVEWVRASLREGDAVLYLNDLPDHYP
ncbi:MAG: hypothetical protein B7Z69_01320 [Actinobacteria bacterium 21-73-9]|nr:MAG: hypothetical protein B7Z69_01320 [Actinobacteria bacterium 21-73-9]